tara:strand:- start:1264 stop:1389 length:126 start_codon:yes stop_codon:yes gene_type:complete
MSNITNIYRAIDVRFDLEDTFTNDIELTDEDLEFLINSLEK